MILKHVSVWAASLGEEARTKYTVLDAGEDMIFLFFSLFAISPIADLQVWWYTVWDVLGSVLIERRNFNATQPTHPRRAHYVCILLLIKYYPITNEKDFV